MDLAALSNVVFGLFVLSWLAAALWAGRTAGSFSWRGQLPLYATGTAYFLALGAASWAFPAMRARLWPPHPAFDATMLALLVGGIAWCWWARIHMGRLWSLGVVVKEEHRVVDTGPYAVVRHPIYTGAFVLMFGFVMLKARPVDLLFCAGFIAFFCAKARVEERFLREQFGEAYERYRAKVPMLVPGG